MRKNKNVLQTVLSDITKFAAVIALIQRNCRSMTINYVSSSSLGGLRGTIATIISCIDNMPIASWFCSTTKSFEVSPFTDAMTCSRVDSGSTEMASDGIFVWGCFITDRTRINVNHDYPSLNDIIVGQVHR
jgi:hypothetical protein